VRGTTEEEHVRDQDANHVHPARLRPFRHREDWEDDAVEDGAPPTLSSVLRSERAVAVNVEIITGRAKQA
jgi:hypothetical protein